MNHCIMLLEANPKYSTALLFFLFFSSAFLISIHITHVKSQNIGKVLKSMNKLTFITDGEDFLTYLIFNFQ